MSLELSVRRLLTLLGRIGDVPFERSQTQFFVVEAHQLLGFAEQGVIRPFGPGFFRGRHVLAEFSFPLFFLKKTLLQP
ncbi:MAG: hypothetical protein KDA71_25870 [Planctomycetales bacterium]|nr:hypothetical protein [Planctomycetales bacterium]